MYVMHCHKGRAVFTVDLKVTISNCFQVRIVRFVSENGNSGGEPVVPRGLERSRCVEVCGNE